MPGFDFLCAKIFRLLTKCNKKCFFVLFCPNKKCNLLSPCFHQTRYYYLLTLYKSFHKYLRILKNLYKAKAT